MSVDDEARSFAGWQLIDVLTHYIDDPAALRRGEDQQRAMLKSARYQVLRLELELLAVRLTMARDTRDPRALCALRSALAAAIRGDGNT